MRHLTLVPNVGDARSSPAPGSDRGAHLSVLTSDLSAGFDDAVDFPTVSPEALHRFQLTEELLEGLSPAEQLEAARTLYYDAEGNPRARSLNLRLI